METTQIAMHELKAALSATVARAAAGEVIEVTSHGKPLARLIGVPATRDPGLSGLMTTGAVTWGGGKPEFAPPIALPSHAQSLAGMVIEDRG